MEFQLIAEEYKVYNSPKASLTRNPKGGGHLKLIISKFADFVKYRKWKSLKRYLNIKPNLKRYSGFISIYCDMLTIGCPLYH